MIHLRPARESDRTVLLEWRNDPTARAASRRPDPIRPEEHDAWFTRTLNEPDHVIYLGEVDGAPMGMVRFDRERDRMEVSINLDPAFRGKGRARELLTLAIARIADEVAWPELVLVARIREDNGASRRIFDRLGFEPTGEQDGDFAVYQRPAIRPADPS